MNAIWTTLIISSIISLCFVEPAAFLNCLMQGATTSIETTVTLCGIFCIWTGLFNIMEDCGLVEKLSKLTQPLLKRIYGKIDDVAASYIALNMSANLLGVSNAATPSAVKAIKILEKQNTTLSHAGTMLFVINATSIQLLPSTVMGMRASLGSANAADIILPTLISTVATTIVGILLVNLFCRPKPENSPQIATLPKISR